MSGSTPQRRHIAVVLVFLCLRCIATDDIENGGTCPPDSQDGRTGCRANVDDVSNFMHRFQKYQETVCEKCARRRMDCGCSEDAENDSDHAFGLLKEYMLQYEQWREDVAQQHEVLQQQFVAVELKNGLGNQLLAFVNSLLVAICLKRALLVDRQTDYRYQDFGRQHSGSAEQVATAANQVGEFDTVISFMSRGDVEKGNAAVSSIHLFMDQRDGAQKLLCDLSPESFADFDIVSVGNSNEDPHLILDNPSCPYLRHAFRGLPFFFLSHFLWSGALQRATPVPIVSLPSPMPWDGLKSVAALHAELYQSGAHVIALHVRIAGNMQYHHFDHFHLLAGHTPSASADANLEAFCSGHPSSLNSMHRCLETVADQVEGRPVVVLWAADNNDLAKPLLQLIASMPDVTLVSIQHGVETSNGLSSGMVDMEFLDGANDFIGTPQSTYSFSAHARGLIAPKYGSFARHGQQCAAGRGPEAGLLSLAPLPHRCQQTGWNLTCHSLADACLALVSGHARLGECLQDVALQCRGGDTQWAADYVLELRHMDFMTQFWARHGGVIDYAFEHRGVLPACWPRPMMRPTSPARQRDV